MATSPDGNPVDTPMQGVQSTDNLLFSNPHTPAKDTTINPPPGHTVRADPEDGDATGRDQILYNFGVRALQQFGYINHLPGQQPPHLDPYFVRPSVQYMNESRNVPVAEVLTNPIHPIFKRDNFKCTDHEYGLLTPSLQLPSGFLNEPALQPFFAGIYSHHTHVPVPGMLTSWFDDRPTPDYVKDRFTIWKQVARLQHHIQFVLASGRGESSSFACSNNVAGPYDPAGAKYGFVDGTTLPVIIEIEEGFMSALGGSSPALSLPCTATLEETALKLRVDLHIAMGLVHELGHALWNVSKQWFPNTDNRWDVRLVLRPKRESFYRDQREAEIGYALESLLFDGMCQPTGVAEDSISNRWLASPVCGFHIARFPGGHDGRTSDIEPRGTAAQYGSKWTTLYPVAQDWVHRFFTKDFWQQNVPQYKLKAYHPQRWHGIRCAVPRLEHGQQLLVCPDRSQSPLPPREGRINSPPPPIADFGPDAFITHTPPIDWDMLSLSDFGDDDVSLGDVPSSPLDGRKRRRSW
ncbi:hypothetical protein BDV97DRAFT_415462 [Delphinella strobiligena]|nr:hypothetical protein BDV97DRAFT_415462 [Delphinella strobiligena]